MRIELRGIGKRFAATVANADVDLAVATGEIHALLGENGAGKSTLVKIIFGLLRPDAGEILWEGNRSGSPVRMRRGRWGSGWCSSIFSLFERMTVLENVALGMETHESPAVLALRIRQVSEAYHLPLDPERPVYSLSVGERQRIEIVRCLLQSPRLLIMDEPTSVLTPQEASLLFETLRQLASEGCSILYISHKLAEIRALCDRATVLRGGRVVATCDPEQETPGSLARMMIGAPPPPPARTVRATGEVRLAVTGLSMPASGAHGTALDDISFEVRGGEVLGIAGVAGNGQSELFAALSGEVASSDGSVVVEGVAAGGLGPAARRRIGLCAVPEERNGHAAVPSFTLVENALLTGAERMGLARHSLLVAGAAAGFAEKVVSAFDVRCSGVGATAGELSGGNLQKFVVGREIMQNPSVLVVAQPTWGVDAGAASIIHAALLELATGGAAVVVISQDLDELHAISDRLAVMAGGRLVEAGATREVDTERVGLLMAGASHAAH